MPKQNEEHENTENTEDRILFKLLVEKEKRLAKKCITEPVDSDKMVKAVNDFLKKKSGTKKISHNNKKR